MASDETKPTETAFSQIETPHFVVRYRPGTHGEREAKAVAERLGGLKAAIGRLLDVAGQLPKGRLGIVLHELPDAVPEEPADGLIHAVCVPEDPALDADVDVACALLDAAVGGGASESEVLIDGLLGRLELSPEDLEDGIAHDATAEALRGGKKIRLEDVLSGAESMDEELRAQSATSFVTWLLETEGAGPFRTFLKNLDPEEPDRAAESAYKRPLHVLEQAWLAKVATTPTTALSVGQFVRRAIGYLRPHWKAQVAIFAAMGVGLAFDSILPLSQQWLIDLAIVPGDLQLVFVILGVLFALFLVQSVTSLGKEYLNARVSAAVMMQLRERMFAAMQRLSMGYFGKSRTGDLLARMTGDLESVEQALTHSVHQIITASLGIASAMVLMFVLDWQLALLGVVLLSTFVLGPRIIGPRASAASYQRQDDAGTVASAVQENLSGQAVVKVFGLEAHAIERFRVVAKKLFESDKRLGFLGSLFGMVAGLSGSLVQVATLGAGAYLVVEGQMTLGGLIAFLGLQGNVMGPIQELSEAYQEVQEATGGMQRIDELLDEKPQVEDAPDAEPAPRLTREIALDDVVFSYTGEQVNLRNVSLKIPAGGWYALVGGSGSGKSTVLNLLLRLYDPSSGRVTIDGTDLRGVTQASLRAQIGVVLQESFLFNASVRDNIRHGRLDATDQDIENAARAAEIHDVIVGLPNGYDTVVGERGGRLSGGQRQRVAIARALVRDPAILLLDEATSALDPDTEAAIIETLVRVGKDRTVISVTHRLTSVVHATRIFVFERGRLVEEGTHAELLEKQRLFAQLWHQQQGTIDDLEADRLARVPIFGGFDATQRHQLARLVVTERYAPGDEIVREGEIGDRLFIIDRGTVEVVASGPGGRTRKVARLRDGDYFGEVSLLRDTKRVATVRALSTTSVMTMRRDQFRTLLAGNDQLRAAFEAKLPERGGRRLAPT